MTTIPVTFALRGADLVHINDVANGLACGCVCPGCGDRMVAKQGAITIHHFAHEGGSDCAGGLETTLHLAAKALLSKERRLVLPEASAWVEIRDGNGRSREVRGKILSAESIIFDEVVEEKRLGSIIPDLICKAGERSILVEIAVTHFVDEIKREKIKALGLECIEIDLSGLAAGWNWHTLKKSIVDGVVVGKEHKRWIAHPKSKELRAELQRREQQKADMEKQAMLEEKRMKISGWDEALRDLDKFKEFEKSEAFQRECDALNEAGRKEQAWLSAAKLLSLDWDNPPNFIDIPVPGEPDIHVARKVWQATLYASLVVQARKGTGAFHSRLGPLKFSLGLPKRHEHFVLRHHSELLTESQKDALPDATKAIVAYLDALVDLGYLKKDDIYYSFQEGAPYWKGDLSGD